MKIIMCTLLLVAVLSQQTEACGIKTLAERCSREHFDYSYNHWTNECFVSEENHSDHCAVTSVPLRKCNGRSMTFTYVTSQRQCMVKLE